MVDLLGTSTDSASTAVTISRYLPCQIDAPLHPRRAYMGQMDQYLHLPRAMTIYRIIRIGSEQTSWAIERDGQIIRKHPSAAVLGAYLDAILAGVNEHDADDIVKVIERRPRPSYEERVAMFSPTGKSEPSRELFPNVA